MQTITLNIGLRTSQQHFNEETRGTDYALTKWDISSHAKWVAAALFTRMVSYYVAESDTERTLVVQVQAEDMPATHMRMFMSTVKFIADTLDQDCIAVYNNTTGFGELVGSYAHEWGEFNKDYFIL